MGQINLVRAALPHIAHKGSFTCLAVCASTCISPTVLTESIAYHTYFTGFTPVPAEEVALAISHPITEHSEAAQNQLVNLERKRNEPS
jgi:hypothetical protein